MDDEFLKQFTAPSMDVARFASDCVKTDSIPATLARLTRGFAQLNSSIKKEVSLHETSLLDQTSHIALLEEALRTAREGVGRIEAAAEAVTGSVEGPLRVLSDGVLEMERLQAASELLRQTLRFLGLVKRLERHVEAGQVPQAARCLAELAPLEGPEAPLALVDEVQRLGPAVEAARTAVRARASSMLMDGMMAQAQQDVTGALLAFAALGTLREKVRTAVSISSNRARRVVDSGIGADEGGEDQWAALEATCGELHELCLAVWHLQHVLLRTRDPPGGPTLWEAAKLEQPTLTEPFWVQLAAKLGGALALPARRSLHRDYPRLFRLLRDFTRKSMLSYEMLQLAAPHKLEESVALAALLRPVAAVALAHTARSKRRLARAAEGLLAVGPRQPDEARAGLYCKTLTKELLEARDAPAVGEAVAAEVRASVQQVAEEAVRRMERSPAELSVATQTPAHVGNAALHNLLLAVEGALRSVCFSLPRDYESSPALAAALASCLTARRQIVSALAAAMAANASAGQHFRSAVVPLYQPSKLFDQVFDGKKA
jgi:hypothetical protein